jgi:hypothetical protein
MKNVMLIFWGLAMGAIVLEVFFTTVGSVSPREIGAVTAVVIGLAILWTIRSMRINFELRTRGGNPQLRADHNRARERRGF